MRKEIEVCPKCYCAHDASADNCPQCLYDYNNIENAKAYLKLKDSQLEVCHADMEENETKIISIIDALELKFDEAMKNVAGCDHNELKPIAHYNGIAAGISEAIVEILETFPHLREKYPHV